jgi:hypothetical protein
MWITAIVAAMMAVCATTSLAWVNLEANSTGSQARIFLEFNNTYGSDIVGLIVTRYQLGTCETPAIVTEAPVLMPPGEHVVYLYVPIPVANAFYSFEAKLVDADGVMHSIPDEMVQGIPATPRDLTSNGSAVVMRGILSRGGVTGRYLYVAPCQDGCWGLPTETILVAATDAIPNLPWTYFLASSGLVVDIIGIPNDSNGMLGPEGNYIVESLQVAPAGSCGAVGEELRSWGSTKVLFR